jgi:hypothetical protein
MQERRRFVRRLELSLQSFRLPSSAFISAFASSTAISSSSIRFSGFLMRVPIRATSRFA